MAPKRNAEGGAGAPPAKKAKGASGAIPVDGMVPDAKSYTVSGDLSAKLNQTNIGSNNNKYYVIQLLARGGKYFVLTRWGRVGDQKSHQMKLDGPLDEEKGKKQFKSMFSKKTSNSWDQRADFRPKPGKYTLIDVDEKESAPSTSKGKAAPKAAPRKSTSLERNLAEVLRVILSQDMFKSEMQKQQVDVDKLPLGKLTKAQIAKGNAVLAKLKAELEKSRSKPNALTKLSSDFFTLIPHNFGWKKPTPIDSMEAWSKKVDLVNTLNDIELAQGLQGAGTDPLSDSYKKLGNKMALLPSSAKEHKVISTYFDRTKPGSWKLQQVFSLERSGEKGRMQPHSKLGNRRLLWHGTSPAVVAAILNSGLRIMPHSGGRVGKGVYLASENAKSAGYTGSTEQGASRVGFMFLVEAALGKMYSVHQDGPPRGFKAAPGGCDSVKAEGRQETFDPKADRTIPGPFGDVAVPQKKPAPTAFKGKSSFHQSEYLVYKESQTMLRYLCVVKM